MMKSQDKMVAIIAVAAMVAFVAYHYLDLTHAGVADRAPVGRSAPYHAPGQRTKAPHPPLPANNPGTWLTSEDYPARPLREKVQGLVYFRVDVSPEGEVTRCTITKGGGIPEFDGRVCAAVTTRARFLPAVDAQGKAIAGIYSNRVRFVLP